MLCKETWGNGASDLYDQKKWERFHWELWELLIGRRKECWERMVDFIAQYEPGDYSLAALAALGIEVSE